MKLTKERALSERLAPVPFQSSFVETIASLFNSWGSGDWFAIFVSVLDRLTTPHFISRNTYRQKLVLRSVIFAI
ncbi:MAG: hypothetical protein AAB486_04970 [Patescibacteria group bacterium]